MELYTKSSADVDVGSGKVILPLQSLDMEMSQSDLLHLTCTDAQGHTIASVSYTHLDVYKRQLMYSSAHSNL